MEKTRVAMEHTDGRRCEECHFFGVMRNGATVCRLNPPRCYAAMLAGPVDPRTGQQATQWATQTAWPAVMPEEWCGKFLRRTDG